MRKRPVCYFTGLSAVLWGLWLTNPLVDSFVAPSYAQMGRVTNEVVWGLTFVLAGGILVWGAYSGKRWPRMIGSIAVLMLRLFVLVLIGLANRWITTGIPDFAMWALMAFYCFVRAMNEQH